MYTHAAVARRCLWAGFRPQLWLLLFTSVAAATGCGSGGSGSSPDGGGPTPDGGAPDGGSVSETLSCAGVSGDRVRQVVRENGDGTSQFVRLHDTQFGETCAFGVASDGVLRCLPAVDGAPFTDGVVLYSDNLCSTRIGQLAARAGDPAPRYMRQSFPAADVCAGFVPSFYELGAKLPIAAGSEVFTGGPGACATQPAIEADYFAISRDVAPGEFVAGARSDTASGRISLSQVDGEDGSRFCDVLGPLRDGEFDRACTPQLGEDGKARCLPGEASTVTAFANADCSGPVDIAIVGQCNASAAYVTDPAPSACPLLQRVRQIGGPSAPRYLPGKVCSQIVDPQTPHDVGASISSFSFAELSEDVAGVGGERLDRVDLITGDGLRLWPFVWLDRDYGEPCAFRPAADGDQRCLPIDSPLELVAHPTVRYADDLCAQPVTVAERDESCALGAPKFVLENLDGGRTRVYEAGAEQAGPLYQIGEGCVPVPAGSVFYRIGPEIPALRFVGGVEMVE